MFAKNLNFVPRNENSEKLSTETHRINNIKSHYPHKHLRFSIYKSLKLPNIFTPKTQMSQPFLQDHSLNSLQPTDFNTSPTKTIKYFAKNHQKKQHMQFSKLRSFSKKFRSFSKKFRKSFVCRIPGIAARS